MKITKFDRTSLRLISSEIDTALKPLEEKFGIKFTYKGARFTAENATFKIEGATLSTDGTVVSKERQEFISLHSLYNLPKDILDKEISYAGDTYIVTGLNTRSTKFPVTAKRVSDGKGFKLTATGVVSAWNNKKQVTV